MERRISELQQQLADVGIKEDQKQQLLRVIGEKEQTIETMAAEMQKLAIRLCEAQSQLADY